jgi:predicted DNA binding protein
MATLVTATLAPEEFVLSETLAAVPEATFECEKIVETSDEAMIPLVWARAPDRDELHAALRGDPTTENVELLAEFDEERLYRMEWIDRVRLIVEIITSSGATILEASTVDDRWILRMIYPDRDCLNRTETYCENHNLTFDIEAIRELDGDPAGRYGLTDEQYEALTTAYERGFFDVPRECDLDDLADEMGISHQALSERLRRATDALVTDTLIVHQTMPEIDRKG